MVGWPVIGQFSSIGSLGASADMWLRGEWLDSMSAVRSARDLLSACAKPPLQLVIHIVFHIRRSSCEMYSGRLHLCVGQAMHSYTIARISVCSFGRLEGTL